MPFQIRKARLMGQSLRFLSQLLINMMGYSSSKTSLRTPSEE